MTLSEFILLIVSVFLFFLNPFYQKATGRTTPKRAKRILTIFASIFLVIFLVLLVLPHLKSYLDSKGYVLQLPISFRPFLYRKTQGEAIAPRLPFEPPPVPEKEMECDADYCSTFEREDWEGWEQFRDSTKYPGAFIPSLEREVFDTARLWYKEFQPPPTFKMELTVKPYHPEMGNIVISYGTIWRCIIAEDNYNTVTCEGEKPFQERQSGHFTGKEKKPIASETDVSITLETILTGEKKIKIVMNVDYIDINSNKSSADFDFTVSMTTPKPTETKEYIGVGIIDPKRKDPALEFKTFKLWKR